VVVLSDSSRSAALRKDGRQLARDVSRWQNTAATSDRGIYAAPLLPLGRYEVSIRAIGFAAQSPKDLVLRVGQSLDVPFTVSRQAVALAGVKVLDRQGNAVNTTRSEQCRGG